MAKKSTNQAPVGNALIGQSGGPTAVINQSLVGAALEAREHPQIRKFYGALHGVKGILRKELIDLGAETPANLEKVAATPSAALGSVRMKPTEKDCADIFEVLRALEVAYFFYIGGNDSAETAHILHTMAKSARVPLRLFHIPKTIDNDLRVTDHCPGFGSAARYVASAFMGDDMDNRSLPGVKINVVMGRNAGFLTAAAALGRTREDSGPHLIYVPERPFGMERFADDVKKVLDRHGRCLVAVSEGIQDASGKLISADLISGTDSHGNARLSGSGALGDFLADALQSRLGKSARVRADTLGYMQRSFAGIVSGTDAAEAREVGRLAVRYAVGEHEAGSVSILREPGKRYKVRYARTPLDKVAKVTKHLPANYINKAGNDVTAAFVEWAAPLAGPLPTLGFLKAKRVAVR